MTTIEWCCLGFQSGFRYKPPGERGIAILVGRDSALRLEVVLQFRSVDIESESALPRIAIPITLCTDLRVCYCPWCGADLEAQYARWADLLVRPGFRVNLGRPE